MLHLYMTVLSTTEWMRLQDYTFLMSQSFSLFHPPFAVVCGKDHRDLIQRELLLDGELVC